MPTSMVGARELKARLGTYLRRVRQGHRLVVTDRGRAVAELRPIEGDSVAALLVTLEARGAVTRPTRSTLVPVRPIAARGTSLSDAVVEDRADRL